VTSSTAISDVLTKLMTLVIMITLAQVDLARSCLAIRGRYRTVKRMPRRASVGRSSMRLSA
jgi:hypothetical protein